MNNDKEIELLKEQTHDLADRAFGCDATSEDYPKYQSQIATNLKIMVEDAKNRMEYEAELKRIEVEKMKIQAEQNWKNPKVWLPIAVSMVTAFGTLAIQGHILKEHRRETMMFEQDGNMFTTLAGRANQNWFSKLLGGNKGLM